MSQKIFHYGVGKMEMCGICKEFKCNSHIGLLYHIEKEHPAKSNVKVLESREKHTTLKDPYLKRFRENQRKFNQKHNTFEFIHPKECKAINTDPYYKDTKMVIATDIDFIDKIKKANKPVRSKGKVVDFLRPNGIYREINKDKASDPNYEYVSGYINKYGTKINGYYRKKQIRGKKNENIKQIRL